MDACSPPIQPFSGNTHAPVHSRFEPVVIGRDEDIKSMKQQLSNPDIDIVGLFGSAGSGKSYTAKEVVRQLTVEQKHVKVCSIDMSTCQEEDLWHLRFIEALNGCPPKKTVDFSEHFSQWLRMNTTDYVLLLDNCESIGANIVAFNRFIASVIKKSKGKIKCLLISQRRISIEEDGIEMYVHRWKSLQPNSAAALFLYHAGSSCLNEEVRCICDLCGNIPLTVKYAARLVKSGRVSCTELVESLRTEEIAQVFEFADSDLSLTRVLKKSFERFSRDEQKEYVRLCALPGTFTKEVANAVLHNPDTIWRLPCIEYQPHSGLYELHCVYRKFGQYQARNPSSADMFCSVFEEARKSSLAKCAEMVIDLSREFAKDAAKVKEKVARHGHHIKLFIEEAQSIPKGLEGPYILAALSSPFLFDTFVSLKERIAFYQSCIQAASITGRELEECQLCYWQAQDLIGEGRMTEALQHVELAERAFMKLNSDEQTSLSGFRHYTSAVLLNRGDPSKAGTNHPCYKNAVEAFLTIHPLTLLKNKVIPQFICGSLGIHAMIEYSAACSRVENCEQQAVNFSRLGLRLCNLLDKSESHPDSLLCLNAFAIAQMSCKQYQKALDTFCKALEVQKTLTDNHRDLAILLANIGQCYAKLGNNGKARGKFVESYDMLKDLYGDNHKETLRSQFELAVDCQNSHDYELAWKHYSAIWAAVDKMDDENKQALDFKPNVVWEQMSVLQCRLEGDAK
jgi:tetratricopeptide (TPR) repeat protein/ABC-type dipeptide/oligopeptide/nickel transport system ATPase component